MIIDPAQRREIDGLVAAWLPGSEGAGAGDPTYDPLYSYGFGLRTRTHDHG